MKKDGYSIFIIIDPLGCEKFKIGFNEGLKLESYSPGAVAGP